MKTISSVLLACESDVTSQTTSSSSPYKSLGSRGAESDALLFLAFCDSSQASLGSITVTDPLEGTELPLVRYIRNQIASSMYI